MGPRWKGKGSEAKALANPISRSILDLQCSLIKSNSQGILCGSNVLLLVSNREQTELLNLTCFGKPIITVTDKQSFEFTLEEAFYLCFSLKCIKILGDDNSIKTHNELWDYMTSEKPSFPDSFKAYSHLRDKNWVVMSGHRYGVDFVAYRHHPSLVHSEYAVLVLSEGNANGNDRLRVWSDYQCTLRLCGGVAKTLLTLHVNRNGSNLIGSSPSCLEGYSVKERTITRWDRERRREDQPLETNSGMDRLPSNIMFDIFSRVPVKCLARARCVSKVWCKYIDDRYLMIIHDKRVAEEPTPILYDQHLSCDRTTIRLRFHVIESKQTESTHDYDLKPKEGPFSEFLFVRPLSSYLIRIRVLGYCNGVLCLSQDDNMVVTALVAVHPLRKERYELPPVPLLLRWSDFMTNQSSCGLGFDASTNTLKMVCVFKERAPVNNSDMVTQNTCTMVHVFGTNSWREIPQVPSYPIFGKAIFANGCLHWLFSRTNKDGGRGVIWFDINKEEFGLINPPKSMSDLSWVLGGDHLIDLNGEVGYVLHQKWEVWVLKQKQYWVPHCRFDIKQFLSYSYIQVLGCWNKDGDMLISNEGDGKHKLVVYNVKSGVLHKANIVTRGYDSPNIFMHPNNLFSIHGIGANSFLMKKTDLK